MARKRKVSPTGHTILVVDDQEEVLVSTRTLLEREGHAVLTAESGARALALFKEHEVHLLLVDYFMPQMTGEDLIREIRRFDPYVQIILQTGYAGEKPARQMMAELDIQGYQDKADGPEKLLLWIDAGLKAHRLVSRLRERERLQGELVANVSHEFRTPLNIIAGYTDLLLDGEFGLLPESTNRPLQILLGATQNLADLVADFLSYAKLEAGAMKVDCQWVATDQIATELERLALLLVEGKSLGFVRDLRQAPPAVFTDAVKLRTILRNLITNAAKFTAAGTIALAVARRDAGVEFTVRDTGPGIAADQLEVIFEPFRQIDGSATRQQGGIGLGLALCRKLARVLGGDLTVKSEPGLGSVFTLTLPGYQRARDAAEVSSPLHSRDGGLTVLGQRAEPEREGGTPRVSDRSPTNAQADGGVAVSDS